MKMPIPSLQRMRPSRITCSSQVIGGWLSPSMFHIESAAGEVES